MNVILFIVMIWIPDVVVPGGSVVDSDYTKLVFATEAECTAALQGETKLFWTTKPGHRMLGHKQCTDGTIPLSISIGTMNIIVEPTP